MTVRAEPPEPETVNNAPLRVFVVPHTHWDREWYHVAPRFRQRLVALIDTLLDYPQGPFLLDGQAITLRDYLAVRPEREGALRRALASGALEAGPWFVLADNLIPSGEAIVRNLEAGARVLRYFGAAAPAVAYCPDSFGHPAAMPAIAAGFGLPVAIVWRGLGGTQHPPARVLRWQSPDGTAVAICHLPHDGYEFGSALPTDTHAARARWHQLAPLLSEAAPAGVALLLNGADHHARQRALPQALAALQIAAGSTATITHSTLSAWASAFVNAWLTQADVPVVRGELRDSYGYTWTLGGTLATRAPQKRRNALLERGLLRDVEPWIALTRLYASEARDSDDARIGVSHLPALLHRAWEDLLATHPHDTLCGCSTDGVARSMDLQQELVAEQGKGLRAAALEHVIGYNAVAARAPSPRGAPQFDWRRLLLRNRAARARGGVATVHLIDTLGDVAVGPGSGHAAPLRAASSTLETGAVQAQPLSTKTRFDRRESPQHYPDNDLVAEHRCLLWVPPVPALGVQLWSHEQWRQQSAPAAAVTVRQQAQSTVIDNGRLQLTWQHASDAARESAPSLKLRVDDRELSSLLSLEVQRDEGDTYTPAPRGAVEQLRCTHARLMSRGPLRAVIRLWWRTASRARRARDDGTIVVRTDLVVDAMSPAIVCHVHGHSHRTNHRLQLVWHTDVQHRHIPHGNVWADAAFGPVRRDVITAPAHSAEAVPHGMPMHRWVMHTNAMFGATMIADGLADAHVHDHRLALTLLRGTGELSRNTVNERPGHAGWPVPTPGAQCLGAFSARTALYLHGPMSDDLLSRVRDVCDDVLLPLVGESWRDAAQGGAWGGPEVVGEAFELSGVTLSAHEEEAIVVRLVNLTTRAAWGALRMPFSGPWKFTSCRLDETPIAPPVTHEDALTFEAPPRAIITLRVRRAEPSAVR
ncbi:hypothetical protein [Gemmatimonas sp.]|uniref:glycoside hydrolase family 38 N-terminal domain-containing protein n=1 Tax=Gemmatimonas sp. TaxID=1962908 RepID=UPI003F6EEF6E